MNFCFFLFLSIGVKSNSQIAINNSNISSALISFNSIDDCYNVPEDYFGIIKNLAISIQSGLSVNGTRVFYADTSSAYVRTNIALNPMDEICFSSNSSSSFANASILLIGSGSFGFNLLSDVFEDSKIQKSISLNPNIIENNATLNCSNLNFGLFSVFDINGKLSMSGNINSLTTTINFESLASGIYTFCVGSESCRFAKK